MEWKNKVWVVPAWLGALLLVALPAGDARASGGACPAAWDSSSCSSVCTISGSTWVCDASLVAGANITMVEDFDSSPDITGDFEAWGDLAGAKFCCQLTNPNASVQTVEIIGSDDVDTLAYRYFDGVHYYNMQGTHGTPMTGTILGHSSGDTIDGSDATSLWSETLYGEGGLDTIHGNSGDDTVYGGTSNDTIYGGPGDDELFGDDGSDHIEGGPDADTIHGGNDDDVILGDGNDDVLFGDAGTDRIEGGAGNDELHGGPSGATTGDTLCDSTAGGTDIFDDGDNTSETTGDILWDTDGTGTFTCGGGSVSVNTRTRTSPSTYCTGAVLGSSRPATCP